MVVEHAPRTVGAGSRTKGVGSTGLGHTIAGKRCTSHRSKGVLAGRTRALCWKMTMPYSSSLTGTQVVPIIVTAF